jgi:beta-galactosidase/beta-glucuronidase
MLCSPRLRWFAAGILCAPLLVCSVSDVLACGPASPWPPPFGFPDLTMTAGPSITGGRSVTIDHDASGFVYRVNGQAEFVRGMGYNPGHASLLTSQRRMLLERDFEAMRNIGVNTVFGWDPAAFDGLTLDAAEEYGLGVAVPYDVDFSADLADPVVRAAARHDVLALVERYRQHPALRMWAIGNELLQRTVPPAWCPPDSFDEASVTKARTLAGFIVETADAVHALDPDHPVIYRESEDAYTGWLSDALREHPAPRPWLIYGVNAYTQRLGEIIDNLPGRGIDGPVLVSEFAPWDAEPGARAAGLRDLWAQIKEREHRLIGAAVYVWYTDGPEAVDQRLGLMDALGRPIDDAVDTIAELFGGAGLPR